MIQTCKVCGEPAAGFHFGAFTCEGCKSFFGRSYNNLSSISECKNNGKCIIDKKNRTTCKACRLRKCYTVGMSKGGSRYGRRSNWFKIHCLLQEQQQQAVEAAGKVAACNSPNGYGDMAAAAAAAVAKQHGSHLAAASHMSGLLGYPTYLPDMMQPTSAFAGHHPADAAAAAAALPFFSMMNSMPNIGSAQSALSLPTHFFFPGYHPGAAAYSSDIFKHRQSVDSAESQRYSPAAHSHSSFSASPKLCVTSLDENQSISSTNHSLSPVSTHAIHSPVPIRVVPKDVTSHVPTICNNGSSQLRTTDLTSNNIFNNTSANTENKTATEEPAITLTFAAQMQSLSPVSVCSITTETLVAPTAANITAIIGQDCPIDLSMKSSRISVHSCSPGDGDIQSDSSEEDLRQAMRRKFYQLSSEQESDASSDASSEAVKRQKTAVDPAESYSGFAHNSTSLHGIFVCV